MIDLPTQKDMNSPHHRRAVWALIGSSILLILLITTYIWKVQEQSDVISTPTQNIVLGQDPPRLDLTPEEIKTRQELMGKPAPVLKLTPEEIKSRQALMGQN